MCKQKTAKLMTRLRILSCLSVLLILRYFHCVERIRNVCTDFQSWNRRNMIETVKLAHYKFCMTCKLVKILIQYYKKQFKSLRCKISVTQSSIIIHEKFSCQLRSMHFSKNFLNFTTNECSRLNFKWQFVNHYQSFWDCQSRVKLQTNL